MAKRGSRTQSPQKSPQRSFGDWFLREATRNTARLEAYFRLRRRARADEEAVRSLGLHELEDVWHSLGEHGPNPWMLLGAFLRHKGASSPLKRRRAWVILNSRPEKDGSLWIRLRADAPAAAAAREVREFLDLRKRALEEMESQLHVPGLPAGPAAKRGSLAERCMEDMWIMVLYNKGISLTQILRALRWEGKPQALEDRLKKRIKRAQAVLVHDLGPYQTKRGVSFR